MYNKEKSCCKDNIQVEGNNAKHSKDTCCSSFRERGEGNYQSSVDYPTKETRVSCKAEECTFNEDCMCHAKHIGIAGGVGEALLFKKGKILGKFPEKDILNILLTEIEKM